MAIAFVQAKSVQTSGATSVTTASFTSTSGNFLAAGCSTNISSWSGSPITDSNSNSWSNAWVQNGGVGKAAQYYAESITGGAGHTVTCTRPGGSGVIGLAIGEFSGIAVSSSLDQTASANFNTNVSPYSSGSTGSTAQADELLIGVGAGNTGATPGASIPGLFTDAVVLPDSSPEGVIASYAIVNATGAYAYAFDYGQASNTERAGIATFKATSPAFVQAKSVQSSGATSVTTASFTSTGGNFLSALGTSFTRTFSTTPGSQITDSKSNTWLNAWAGTFAGQFYAENISGGASHTVTCTPPGGSSACALAVLEFSGINTSSSLDQAVSASGSAAPHSSGATSTTAQASEVLIGGGSQSHSTNIPYSNVAGGLFTDIAQLADTSPEGVTMSYRVVSAIATYAYAYALGGAPGTTTGVGIATFKADLSVAGTGAVTIGAPSLAGTGTESDPGTGGVTIGAPTVSDAGSGAGAVTIGHPSVSGAGTVTAPAAGGVVIGAPSVSGVGGVTTVIQGPNWTTNRLFTAPAAGPGVRLTPNATPWADSDWVPILNSTDTASLLCGLVVAPGYAGFNVSVSVEFDVGVQIGSGSVTVIDRFRAFYLSTTFVSPGLLPRVLPLDGIPASARLLVRMRKSGSAVTAWTVALSYFKKPIVGVLQVTANPQFIVPSAADPLSLTIGASAGANSTWTTIIASTTTPIAIVDVVPFGSGLGTDWEFDVGVGSGTPAVVTTVRFHNTTISVADGPSVIPLYNPNVVIPAGAQVSLRTRASAVSFRSASCALVCVEFPL